jgi:hypothetical protein
MINAATDRFGFSIGPSPSYQLNDRCRVQTGRSPTNFQKPKPERLLFPLAVVQTSIKSPKRRAENGQQQTLCAEDCLTNAGQTAMILEFSLNYPSRA